MQLSNVRRWLCYYGDDRRVLDAEGYDLLVLDADAIGRLLPDEKRGRLCLAYLSVGEAGTYRDYWKSIAKKPWLAGDNPNWEGDVLADPRADEWRRLLVEREAPRLLELGYDGLLLDTLDTADTLIYRDPLAYEGAHSAMVRIVAGLREALPDALLVANGGLSILHGTAPYLDGLLFEGARWTYDFEQKDYRRRTDEEIAWSDPRLRMGQEKGLTVLLIEYVDAKRHKEAEPDLAEMRKRGWIPYVGEVALDSWPDREKDE